MKIEKIRQNYYFLLLEYQVRSSKHIVRSSIRNEHVLGSSNLNEVKIDPLVDFDQFVASNSLDVTSKSKLDFYLEENYQEFQLLTFLIGGKHMGLSILTCKR
ncbi:unnamed protein product [Coffea canephora]|uniref:Uncharacterized protein n=1 Tax=Coffea canephora TaxID=49390 RepID=A0A068UK00_COFCA|nr:unnamed protein product [Coffea canephora]